jgi:Ala-tRNA(Pro) deacylase
MPAETLNEYLDHQGIGYQTIPHPRAYTARATAATAHVRDQEMAKAVILKVDGRLAMAVLPADRMVHLRKVRRATGAGRIELAAEGDFRNRFPGCELGAMPPFGNLYGMEVFVDSHLAEDEEIAFNAGTHTELLRLRYRDFERLAQPRAMTM